MIYLEPKLPCDPSSATDLFTGIDQVSLAVVPQENSTFGSVVETYDALRSAPKSLVRGEIVLQIQHSILCRDDTNLADITCILSHEQVREPNLISLLSLVF